MGGRLLEGRPWLAEREVGKTSLDVAQAFSGSAGSQGAGQMCPLYVSGLIGPGDRKSIQPMAKQLALGDYDQLHHFIAAGVWDAAPLETELLVQADRFLPENWTSDRARLKRAGAREKRNTISSTCRRRPTCAPWRPPSRRPQRER
jgi:SRSO17 transposase